METGGVENSFLGALLKKLADVKRIESETGKSTQPLQDEVWRQIHQVMGKGTILEGQGVTKSGGDD